MTKVSNEGRLIAHKGSPHLAISDGKVDTCYTDPAKTKTGDFENYVKTSLLQKGTTTTFIHNHPIWILPSQVGPLSDPAHDGKYGGIKSGTWRGRAIAKDGSQSLTIENEKVIRSFDPTQANHENCDGQVGELNMDGSNMIDYNAVRQVCSLAALQGGSTGVRRINSPEDRVPLSPHTHYLELVSGDSVILQTTRVDVTLPKSGPPSCITNNHSTWKVERTWLGQKTDLGVFHGDSLQLDLMLPLDFLDGMTASEIWNFLNGLSDYTVMEDITEKAPLGGEPGIPVPASSTTFWEKVGDNFWDSQLLPGMGGIANDAASGMIPNNEQTYRQYRGNNRYGSAGDLKLNPPKPKPPSDAPTPPISSINAPPEPMLGRDSKWDPAYRYKQNRKVAKEIELDAVGALAMVMGFAPTEYKINVSACSGSRTVILRVFPQQAFTFKISTKTTDYVTGATKKNSLNEKLAAFFMNIMKVTELLKWLLAKTGRDADIKVMEGFYFSLKMGYKGCTKSMQWMIGPGWAYPNLVGFFFNLEVGASPLLGYSMEFPVSIFMFAFPMAETVANLLRRYNVARADIVFTLGFTLSFSISFGRDEHGQFYGGVPAKLTPQIKFDAMLVVAVVDFTVLKGGFSFPLKADFILDRSDKPENFLMFKIDWSIAIIFTLTACPDKWYAYPIVEDKELIKFPDAERWGQVGIIPPLYW